MRNNKRALYESIMNKVGSVVYNSINEMEWENIKDKLSKDKRPYARRIGKKVGDYMQSDTYSKNYPQKKYMYVPKTKEELKKYVKFEIKKQGGVNVDLNMIDTRNITNMRCMFECCTSLETLDVSGWDTSNVRDMTNMFYDCLSLKTLDVSGWNTSNVECMNFMFYECSSLETLDVSGWDTSKVEYMSCMFEYCSSLQTLDVSGWDTSNVEDMSYMFWDCSSLQSLDVSGWDISKVKDMEGMFGECSNLHAIDVSRWDTSKVENMKYMFADCRKLKTNISMWHIVSKCETEHMLQGARNIECTWDNAEELMENKRYKRR